MSDKKINSNLNFTEILIEKINETYIKNGFVNINEIDFSIPKGRKWRKNY